MKKENMFFTKEGSSVNLVLDRDEVPFFNEETFEEDYETLEYWLIAYVSSSPESRGKGYILPLLKEAVQKAKEIDADLEIKLWCEPQDSEIDSDRLASLYRRAGFRFSGNECEMIYKGAIYEY